MKAADIYQTLEDRQNDGEVEAHGPYFCSLRGVDGAPKTGVREPWLGEGYYFWDSRIADAQWWGDTVYGQKGYIICHTTYDQHSPLLYDLVGDVVQLDEFLQCANLIRTQLRQTKVSFPVVLEYLKSKTPFYYKAIRVWPQSRNQGKTNVTFPGDKIVLGMPHRIQICFFDKTLLNNPYRIVEKKPFLASQTI